MFDYKPSIFGGTQKLIETPIYDLTQPGLWPLPKQSFQGLMGFAPVSAISPTLLAPATARPKIWVPGRILSFFLHVVTFETVEKSRIISRTCGKIMTNQLEFGHYINYTTFTDSFVMLAILNGKNGWWSTGIGSIMNHIIQHPIVARFRKRHKHLRFNM